MSSAAARRRPRASARHKVTIESPELNLNSMMDMFAVLIPALLMMSALVEVTLLDIAVPSLKEAPGAAPPKPPLELTLAIHPEGYRLSTQEGVLLGKDLVTTPVNKADPAAMTLPLVRQRLRCAHYMDTRPPPRARNASEPACDATTPEREFWAYDLAGLSAWALRLKQAHPEARRLVLDATADVEYESVIDAMDATRDNVDGSGQARTLFDEVLLSPGL